jgi:hypothetical protein
MKRIFGIINVIIAISVGTIVMLAYFIPLPQIQGFGFIALQWAVILAGVAVLIGAFNLIAVHLQKIRQRRPGAIYSVILLSFMFLTIIFSFAADFAPAWKPLVGLMVNGIIVPVEVSLMAVLAISLIYASTRLLGVRGHWTTIIFIVTAVIVLLGIGPLPFVGQVPFLRNLVQVFSTGGARGILIGVALGTLTTGIRILFGVDRPYGGS